LVRRIAMMMRAECLQANSGAYPGSHRGNAE